MIVLLFPPVDNKELPKMLLHCKEFLVGKRIGSVAEYALTLLIISRVLARTRFGDILL